MAGMRNFVNRQEDLVITGKTGTGKSHLLQALGLKACERQISVRYGRCVDIVDDLYAGIADNTFNARMRRWVSPPLLIIDDGWPRNSWRPHRLLNSTCSRRRPTHNCTCTGPWRS
jgi:DNA replication protein DnaC